MARYFIGIDPGVHTGFAVWDAHLGKFVEVETFHICQALEKVGAYRKSYDGDIEVIFEDARQRRWFPSERNNSEYRGRLMGAGAAKRDAKIWEEFLEWRGIKYTAQAPHAGGTKWNKEAWEKITGWKGRTSEHARDAALLVFNRK